MKAEWADFAPQNLRTLVAPDAAPPQDAHVDMTIYAARYGEMATPDGRVALTPFSDAEEAIAMVAARYDDLTAAEPPLAHNISGAAIEDLRSRHDQDQLRAIRAAIAGVDEAVGLIAAAPGSVEWIEGDVVKEEVVLTNYRRQGFAASAQKSWVVRADLAPSRLLVGTINGLNIASRRSALKAGRRALLAYAFLPMPAG